MATNRIGITYLEEGQRQKEAAINDAYDTIDENMFTDLGEYTKAGIPSASSYPNVYAVITDTANGRTIVRSNGSNWMEVAVEGSSIV